MKHARIQPTGNEIRSGIVADTDSPMIQSILEQMGYTVTIAAPEADEQERIEAQIQDCAREGCALMVLIGGSGGGHRHDPGLTRDVTHSAMDRLLCDRQATDLYGKNGHLWSRLVCGYLAETLVINVPGPYREAQAAISAFAAWQKGAERDLKSLNKTMAQAVCATYSMRPERRGSHA